MAKDFPIYPVNEDELIEHALVRLGKPMITINVTPLQCQIRVKEAIEMFRERHPEAKHDSYVAHQITARDLKLKYFTIDPLVWRVKDLLAMDGHFAGTDLWFPVQHGGVLMTHPMYTRLGMYGSPLVAIYLARFTLAEIDFAMYGKDSWHFNRNTHRLTVHYDTSKLTEGNYILMRADTLPEDPSATYANDWLIQYVEALIQRQWGHNLSKYGEVPLPMGGTWSGADILQRAETKIEKLETEVKEIDQYPAIIVG